jgi:hypothetical protein
MERIMPPAVASNGLVDSHEARLLRVEDSLTDLSVKVSRVETKQDVYHQNILDKIEDLSRAEEKVERQLEKKEKGVFGELWPLSKFIRKYFLHICMAVAGAVGHKGWQLIWDLLK